MLSQHVAEAGRPQRLAPRLDYRAYGSSSGMLLSPHPGAQGLGKKVKQENRKKDMGSGPGHSLALQRPQGWVVHLEKVGTAFPRWPGRELVQPTPP